jgi:hypothetical protein
MPGPEHKRLAFYVGKWSGTGDVKPGPMGPAGKMTWTESCEWFAGNFAVVCHADMKGPQGGSKELTILSYNMEEKVYVSYGINSTGYAESSTGTVQGKVWTWPDEGKIGGKPYKMRFTLNEVSNDVYTFRFELSVDGGKTWTTSMEGKGTRAK